MKTIAEVIEETKFNTDIMDAKIENEVRRIHKEFGITEPLEIDFKGLSYNFYPRNCSILVIRKNHTIEGNEKLKLLREVVR